MVVPNALAIARLSVVASLLAISPLPPSRVRPLGPYCPFSWYLTANLLPGLHPTAPHRPAPYSNSPAGTLLLIFVGWHPLCPVALLTLPHPSIFRPFLGYP